MTAAATATRPPIETVADLFDELGGLGGTSKVLQAKKGTAQQWRLRGRIPARFYLSHRAILAGRGLDASPAIWGQSRPPEAVAS